MRKLSVVFGALVLGALVGWAVLAGGQGNPFYIVQNTQGVHITAGTAFPALATTGSNPGDGQIHIDLAGGVATNPVVYVYSLNAAAWVPMSPTGTATGTVPSTLVTNAPDVANSIWGGTNEIWIEGTTADASEFRIQAQDPAVDQIFQLRNLTGGADTYYVHATPDGDVTTGYWTLPPRFTHTADAVVDFTAGDNVMYVYRVYIDAPITVSDASVLLVDGGAIAAADIIGVALYADADAGARLTTGTGDGTAAGLETIALADVTVYPGYYRLGICSSDSTNLHVHATLQDDETIDVIAGVAGDITYGTAANPCVAGVPPATTGALTTADENIPVVMLH